MSTVMLAAILVPVSLGGFFILFRDKTISNSEIFKDMLIGFLATLFGVYLALYTTDVQTNQYNETKLIGLLETIQMSNEQQIDYKISSIENTIKDALANDSEFTTERMDFEKDFVYEIKYYNSYIDAIIETTESLNMIDPLLLRDLLIVNQMLQIDIEHWNTLHASINDLERVKFGIIYQNILLNLIITDIEKPFSDNELAVLTTDAYNRYSGMLNYLALKAENDETVFLDEDAFSEIQIVVEGQKVYVEYNGEKVNINQ